MTLLMALRPAMAIGLAVPACGWALFRGAGWRFLSLAAGIGGLTIALHAFTEPGPEIFRFGPLAVSTTGLVAGSERMVQLIGLMAVAWLMAKELGIERLADFVASVSWPLERRFARCAGLGFALGLAFRFLPEIPSEVARLELALAARPGPARDPIPPAGRAWGGPWRRWRARLTGLEQLFLPLLAGTVRRAGEVALVLSARGYGTGPPTPVAARQFTARERLIGSAMVALAVAVLAADHLVGRG